MANLDSDEPAPKAKSRATRSARTKVMDLLARRDHSELELCRKLAPHFPTDEILEAIAFARENNWLAPQEVIAERAAQALARKNKSHRYISRFLQNRGLPPMARDREGEVAKALAIVKPFLARRQNFEVYQARRKIIRLLINRGFDSETVGAALASLNF